MLGIGANARRLVRFSAAVAAAMLVSSGCASLYPEDAPVVGTVEAAIESPLETIEVQPLQRQPWERRLPPVAIVLTSAEPAYADVARELTGRFKDHEIFDLSDRSQTPVSVLRLINDSSSDFVIAIGLRAAQSSVAMTDKPVIFSQVFNHQDHRLLTGNSRGIAALAPLDAQLAAWKNIDPTIARVGAIIGEGHDELIVEARLAAERHGIDLRVQVTHSDQETLYFFRRMIRDIDGFWLFPDNRVLSGRVLQKMLADANHQRVPVTVPSESMLQMGATISMSTVAADIADTIVRVVRQIQVSGLGSVPPISRLSELRVQTNGTIQVVER
jgi:ABC-type uncharacterized transport system substrate-binding protein